VLKRPRKGRDASGRGDRCGVAVEACFTRFCAGFGWFLTVNLTDPGSLRFGDAARSTRWLCSENKFESVWGVVHFCGFF
jgi:hypothetical protein